MASRLVFCRNFLPWRWRTAGAAAAAAGGGGGPPAPEREQQQQQNAEGSANSRKTGISVSARLRLLKLTGNSISSPFHGGYYALLLLLTYTALLVGGVIGLPWLLLSCWAAWGLRMLGFSCGGLSSLFDILWLPAAVHAAQQRARQVCVKKELRGRLRKELRGLDFAAFLGGNSSSSSSGSGSSSSESSAETPASSSGASAAAAALGSTCGEGCLLAEKGKACGSETAGQRNPAASQGQSLGSSEGGGSEKEKEQAGAAAARHDEAAAAAVGRASLTARRRTSSRGRERQQQQVLQEAAGSPSWGSSRSTSGCCCCCCTEASKAAAAAADQQQHQCSAALERERQHKSPPPTPANVKEELQRANLFRQQRAAAAAAAAAAANARRLLGLTSLEDSRCRAGKAALTEEDIDDLLREAHVESELLAAVFAEAAAAGRPTRNLGEEAVDRHHCCAVERKASAAAAGFSSPRAAAPPAASPSTASAAGDATAGGPTVVTAAAVPVAAGPAAAAAGGGREEGCCSGKQQRSSSGAAEGCFSGAGVPSAAHGHDRVRVGGAPGDGRPPDADVSSRSIHDKPGGSNSSNQAGGEGGGGEDRGSRNSSSKAGGRSSSSEAGGEGGGGRNGSSKAGGRSSSSSEAGGEEGGGGRNSSSEAHEGGEGRNSSSEAGGRNSSSEGGEEERGSGGREGSVGSEGRREEKQCSRCLIPWQLIFRCFLAHCECTYLVDLLFCHAELSPLSSSIQREVLLLLHCFIRGMTVFLAFASPYCFVPYSHRLRTRQLLSTLCICMSVSFGAVAGLLLVPLVVEDLLQPLLRLLLLPDALAKSELLLLLTDARLALPSLPASHGGSTWDTRADFYAVSQLLTVAVVSVGAYAAAVRLYDAEPRVAAAARRAYATDLLALLALEKRQQQQQQTGVAADEPPDAAAAAATRAAQRGGVLGAARAARECRGEGRSRRESVAAARPTAAGRDSSVRGHTGAAGRGLTGAGEGSRVSGCGENCVDEGGSAAGQADGHKGCLSSAESEESRGRSRERQLRQGVLQSSTSRRRPEEEPRQQQQQERQQQKPQQSEEEEREEQEKEEAAGDEEDGRLSLLLAEKVVEERQALEASDLEVLRGRVVRRLVQAGGAVAACCLLLCWTAVALLAASNVAMRVNTASDIFQERENVRLMSAAAAAASLLGEQTAGGLEDWAEDLRLLQEEVRDLMNYYARIQRQQGWTAVAAELWEQLGEEFSAARQERASQQKQEMNAYAVLGVKPTATGADIKKAYKLLAKQLHPDLLAAAAADKPTSPEELDAATERMRRINAAYEKLMRKHGGRGGRSG